MSPSRYTQEPDPISNSAFPNWWPKHATKWFLSSFVFFHYQYTTLSDLTLGWIWPILLWLWDLFSFPFVTKLRFSSRSLAWSCRSTSWLGRRILVVLNPVCQSRVVLAVGRCFLRGTSLPVKGFGLRLDLQAQVVRKKWFVGSLRLALVDCLLLLLELDLQLLLRAQQFDFGRIRCQKHLLDFQHTVKFVCQRYPYLSPRLQQPVLQGRLARTRSSAWALDRSASR